MRAVSFHKPFFQGLLEAVCGMASYGRTLFVSSQPAWAVKPSQETPYDNVQ